MRSVLFLTVHFLAVTKLYSRRVDQFLRPLKLECKEHQRHLVKGSSCFYIGEFSTSWQEAMQMCREQGARLAHIYSDDMTQAVTEWLDPISDYMKQYHIGMKLDPTTNTMSWMTEEETATDSLESAPMPFELYNNGGTEGALLKYPNQWMATMGQEGELQEYICEKTVEAQRFIRRKRKMLESDLGVGQWMPEYDDVRSCAEKCVETPGCLGFNKHNQNGCQLLRTKSKYGRLVDKPGCHYFERFL